MKFKYSIIVAATLFLVGCNKNKAVKTDFSSKEIKEATVSLLYRVTGEKHDEFKVVITGEKMHDKDWFSLYYENGKIVLEGNNGVSVASALNYYLKNYCGWHYTWCGKNTDLPEVLPQPSGKVTKVSPYKYRYYFNYCTFNYSMSWWDFDRWQQEVDFMALNGINMPLALTGQNSVWQNVYRRLGFSNEQLESFFSGPAYFNWFWMGNIDGWGGPLPQSFIDKHEDLQKKILFAERSLGMTPILPAFTGHVPPAFTEMFPEAKVRKTSWVEFPEVTILDPEEKHFTEIGKMFLEEQTKLYGTNHFYTADTFNENRPPTNDSLFLSGISDKVYNSMCEVDPEAVWVMQGWLFYHHREFWGDHEIKSLLSSVPDDKMLILDLWSERYPVWNRTNAYYGKPWIWCMLHNFGKNIVFSGNAENVEKGPYKALHDTNSGKMQGIGLTMEGIEQNPAIYALMLENVWRDSEIDEDEFIHSYFGNRYGIEDPEAIAAWKIIFNTAYENTVNNGGQESIICGRPSFSNNTGGAINTKFHYDPKDLVKAWEHLISSADALKGRDGYRYDLVDLTRQVLADYALTLHAEVSEKYSSRDIAGFKDASTKFISLIEDMDTLLATRDEFLLGKWLEEAKAMGETPEEKALYEKNARNLISLWGGKDCRIRDYACKQWSGMMNGFYRKRWEMFFDMASKALEAGKELDVSEFDTKCKNWEWDWISGTETYPSTASGDEIEKCLEIYRNYKPLLLL